MARGPRYPEPATAGLGQAGGARGKVCRHEDCKEWKPYSHFYIRKQNSDGYDGWCRVCRGRYSRKYNADKRAGKFMPGIEAQMRAMEAAPKSDEEISLRNYKRYDRHKTRKRDGSKADCAYAGCITRINYLQKKYCLMHESVVLNEQRAKKLERGI